MKTISPVAHAYEPEEDRKQRHKTVAREIVELFLARHMPSTAAEETLIIVQDLLHQRKNDLDEAYQNGRKPYSTGL